MSRSPEPRYDVASGLSQGQRPYQEDTLITDFSIGVDCGFVVLADGMGGHEAGDVASKILVTEVFGELKFRAPGFPDDEAAIPAALDSAVQSGNESLRTYADAHPKLRGMGATLVSLVLVENRLFWMSVGDSPLYLLRDGTLERLNEDHSLAPEIDLMVRRGLLTEEAGRDHPDRNSLTSVVMGREIAKRDCPSQAFELRTDDVLIAASDGLDFLGPDGITEVAKRHRDRPSAEIVRHLLDAIEELDDPDQDNVSISVLKLNYVDAVAARAPLEEMATTLVEPIEKVAP
ncbi:MAG: protein phosphatase 2C domain-containing protein [Pseudomonadota bacterium]